MYWRQTWCLYWHRAWHGICEDEPQACVLQLGWAREIRARIRKKLLPLSLCFQTNKVRGKTPFRLLLCNLWPRLLLTSLVHAHVRPLHWAGDSHGCTSKFWEVAFAWVQREEDRSGHTWVALLLSSVVIGEAAQLNYNGREDNMPPVWAVIEHIPN